MRAGPPQVGSLLSGLIVHTRNERIDASTPDETQAWQARRLHMIAELAGPVAQDCANLLTTIRAGCDLLAGELGETRHRGDIDAIGRAADNATALLRQLAALASTEETQARLIALDDLVAGFERVLLRLLGDAVPLRVDLGHAGFIHAEASPIEHVILGIVLAAREVVTGGGPLWLATERVVVEAARDVSTQDAAGIPPGAYAAVSIAVPGVEGERLARSRLVAVTTAAAMVRHTGGYLREWESEEGTMVELLFPSCVVSSESPGRPRSMRRRGRRGPAARREGPSGPTAA